jgi:UDP-N-acetylmuramoylalanine--D-glutamate ligase
VRAVYRSPGLSPAVVAPVVDAARAIGLSVGGELDLFARALIDLRTVDTAEPAEVEALPAATDAAEPLAEAASETPDAASLPTAAIEDDDDAEAPTLVLPPVPMAPAGYRPAVLAVTGTNGKTTVTVLTGQLVARAGKTVAVAGNIGPTLLDTLAAHIDADTLPEVWVLELSSFQLDGVQDFEPTAATVLNLSQDHLDWHGDMAAYAAAKARIFGAHGTMILNRDDEASWPCGRWWSSPPRA